MACNSEDQACIEKCESDFEFFEVCYDTVMAAGIWIDCYTDTDALEESLAAA